MPRPIARNPDDDSLRQFNGRCYLALRTRDNRWLSQVPTTDALQRSGLAGMYANLCVWLDVPIDKRMAIHGMQLAIANDTRWRGLLELLDALRIDGIEPVVFKGGALHARWPQLRELRALADYDLIVPQGQLQALRAHLAKNGFQHSPPPSGPARHLMKGAMAWKGDGLRHQNLDLHTHVTEPPVCRSLTNSILAGNERADGVRVPDIEDCVCMIALHIVRSGMHRPPREYVDLLWYIDGMDEAQWRAVVDRARRHHLLPALFLSLRQAVHCLAMDALAPERAKVLAARIDELQKLGVGHLRLRALDWLAPPNYPLHPVERRNRPAFRRSVILGAGTSSAWRVGIAFMSYGAARLADRLAGGERIGGGATAD